MKKDLEFMVGVSATAVALIPDLFKFPFPNKVISGDN